MIYANATVLGGNTVVGAGSVIGASVVAVRKRAGGDGRDGRQQGLAAIPRRAVEEVVVRGRDQGIRLVHLGMGSTRMAGGSVVEALRRKSSHH